LPVSAGDVPRQRSWDWKYVHFAGGVPPMLFNLKNDSSEADDLARKPAYSGDLSRLRAARLDRRVQMVYRPFQ